MGKSKRPPNTPPGKKGDHRASTESADRLFELRNPPQETEDEQDSVVKGSAGRKSTNEEHSCETNADPSNSKPKRTPSKFPTRPIVVVLVAIVLIGIQQIPAVQVPTWHGCACAADAEGINHPILLPLLSARARHHTARFMPVHVHTHHSGAEVASWVTRTLHDAPCVQVTTVSSPIPSVEAWRAFLQSAIDARGRRSCLIVVAPYDLLDTNVINSFKEIAESNTLRGDRVLPDATQGLLILAANGDRDWLLEHIQHRTVHVMPSVPLMVPPLA